MTNDLQIKFFQDLAKEVENSQGYPHSIEVDPYVYRENTIANTIVFELSNLILTIHDNGTYLLEKRNDD